MQHKRETKGLQAFRKELKEKRKKEERVQQIKRQAEIEANTDIAYNFSTTLLALSVVNNFLWPQKLMNYWKRAKTELNKY